MICGSRRSVVVTGAGAVSGLGLGIEEVWAALLEGRSARGPSPESPRGIPVPRFAGILGGVGRRLEDVADPRYLRRLAGVSRSTVAAALLCARAARFPAAGADGGLRDTAAVVLGTSFGASAYHFEYYEKLFREGLKGASPLLFSESVMNAAPGHASIYLKLRGPSLALVGGEEVGLTAIADAYDRIRLGEVDAAFAGGAEEYSDFVHAAVAAGGLVGDDSEAFFSEGAALLLLEEEARARSRGAPVLARVSGAGLSRSLEGPEGAGRAVARAARRALEEAGAVPEGVDLVVGAARPPGSAWDVPLCDPKLLLGEGFSYTSAAQALVAVASIATGAARALAISTSRRGNAAAVLLERVECGPGGSHVHSDPVRA